MKNKILIILALSLILMPLAACQEDNNAGQAKLENENQKENNSEEELNISEKTPDEENSTAPAKESDDTGEDQDQPAFQNERDEDLDAESQDEDNEDLTSDEKDDKCAENKKDEPQVAADEISEEDFLKDPLKSTKAIFDGVADVYMPAEDSELKDDADFERAEIIDAASIDFALEILKNQEGNYIFSPASAYICFAMYGTGLTGEGATQLGDLLLPEGMTFAEAAAYLEDFIGRINYPNIRAADMKNEMLEFAQS